MPSFTKKAIQESFLKLLDQRALNKITVKDIVEECGINRNSFYYHFADLPALIEAVEEELVRRLVQRHPTVQSLEESTGALVEFLTEHKRAIYHLYNSLSRDTFERHLMEVSQYLAETYLGEVLRESKLSGEDKKALYRFHKCEIFGLAIDWLNGGMTEDITDYAQRIYPLQRVWLRTLREREG